MPLGQLHGRTRTGPKALNAAAHLMRTFLISLTDLLEEWLKLSIYIYDKLAFSIIVVLRKWNCACPDCFPLHNFFLITQRHMWLSKISLPVLDAFESSSASILSFRLGFLDKSNLLKIPDCPAVDLKKVLSVTKHGFVFWAQRKANATLEIYKAFQERLTFLYRHMIVKTSLFFRFVKFTENI